MLIVIAFLVFAAGESFACTCAPPSIDKALEGADVVFSGKVTKIIESNIHRNGRPITSTVYFKVFKAWKGVTTEEMIVRTSINSPLCGFPFRVGEKYLVFALGEKIFSTWLCSGTKSLRYAKADIKFLGEAERSFENRKKKN